MGLRTSRASIRLLLAVSATGLLAVAFSIFVATRSPASTQVVPSPLLGRVAPTTKGPLLGGGELSLDSLRGSMVLVSFYASWCPSCVQQEQQLVRFSQAESQGVKIVSIDFDDQDAAGLNFLRSAGASWPAISDPAGQIALSWGVDGPPETFLVSAGGKVITKVIGAASSKELLNLVALAQAKGYG